MKVGDCNLIKFERYISSKYNVKLEDFNYIMDKYHTVEERNAMSIAMDRSIVGEQYLPQDELNKWINHTKKLIEIFCSEYLLKRVLLDKEKNSYLQDLNEINSYYANLGISPCWESNLLGLEILNDIAFVFNKLHKIYPNVYIKEIGDCYSFEKISPPYIINKILEEAGIKSEPLKCDYNENKDQYPLSYNDNLKRITFYTSCLNTQYINGFTHEFGHAIADQHNINDNKDIENIYRSMSPEEISVEISDYANSSIKEFIAECFRRSFYDKENCIIESVMDIIDRSC